MRISSALRVALIAVVSGGIGSVAGWQAHGRLARDEALDEARSAYEQKKYDLAIRLAQLQARQSSTPNTEALLVIGRSLAAQRKWSEATKTFEQTVLRTPQDFALHAKSLYFQDRVGEAIDVLSNGLATFPDNPHLAELETRILGYRNRPKDALASAERLTKIPGKEMSGRLLLGLIHYGAKNYELAAANLRRALEISPTLEGQADDFDKTDPAVVNEAIAFSLMPTEKAGDAFEYAAAAYDAKPTLDRALLAAKGAAARRNWREVRKWVDRVLALDPNNMDALFLAIDRALEDGAIPEAERALNKAVALSSKSDAALQHKLNVARARIAATQRSADATNKRK